MKPLAFLLALLWLQAARANVVAAKCRVLLQPGASDADRHAAKELRDHLAEITGQPVPIREGATLISKNSIVVGQGALAMKLFPNIKWDSLGPEETLIRSRGDVLLVAGGSPRGTLYAVYRLLHMKCGVRWWAPWALTIPHNSSLTFGNLNLKEHPAFEYRDPFWFHSFDADWAARNYDNGASTRVDESHGGKITYQGFVHTYYGLVPPGKVFAVHPEWFSLIDGKRTYQDAQLCTTNPELRDYVVAQVRAQLRANPKARIASVSQNDCYRPCQCPVCRGLAAREGSDAALVLDLANYVGEKIEGEFPDVAIDTLAYQWSRHPTKSMRPRKNVIVRLCSIECNFAFPLDAPQNASFGDDIRGWSKLTNRLYVWDYCTNFANYMQPHPDYFTLGPTLKFFAANGVKGVFEEGDYNSNGGDMAELKAWLIAQMLWDPKQDSNKLIDEFLVGYYGPRAAPLVRQYLDLMAKEAQSVNLTFALGTRTPFLRPKVIDEANRLWGRAWASAAQTGEPTMYAFRVGQSWLGVQYVILARWSDMHDVPGTDFSTFAHSWLRRSTIGEPSVDRPPIGWTPVTAINEGGLTPQQFVEQLGIK